MSFTGDFLKGLEKRNVNLKRSSGNLTSDFLNGFEKRTKKKDEEDDIAPVKSTTFGGALLNSVIGQDPLSDSPGARAIVNALKDKEEDEEESIFDGWFKKGDDDVAKTILGTITDVGEDLTTGIVGLGEKAVDAMAWLAPVVSKSQYIANGGGLGFNQEADKLFEEQNKAAREDASKFIKKDLYDEGKVARQLLSNLYASQEMTNIAQNGGMFTQEDLDRFNKNRGSVYNYMVTEMEDDSVLDEKSDSLVQSAGQLGATAALSAVGVPWYLVTGTSTFGSEAESALKQGATYEEAGLSATISAGAEILTEKISGGVKFGGKTLDDALTKVLARNISNRAVRTAAKLGIDMVGEGTEEILSGLMSAIGQKLTYSKEKELEELFSTEDAWESFIGGAVLGGVGSATQAAKGSVTGVDSVTELTKNEQKVVDKVYQDRLAEAEKNGKVTQKQKAKIYDKVLEDMDKGYITTDTIEEILGGEIYKSYKDTVDSEDALTEQEKTLSEEYNKLNKMVWQEMTGEQHDRREELRDQLKDLRAKIKDNEQNSTRSQLKSQLGFEVSELVKGDRLYESYNERARRGQTFEADMTQYDAKQRKVIQKAIDSGILNNTNRTHEFVDVIAKISADKGVPFDFTNNAKLKESGFAVDGKTVNGYVTKDGIAINIDSSKAWQSTVGHEITHVLEGTEMYNTLKQTLFNYAKSKGEYDSRLSNLTELYKDIKDADVEAELTADLVGDYLFQDSDFINRLSTENRNVFQKIYDEIKYLCRVVTAGSKEARELEKVRKAFEDAYRADGKAKIGTKYSISETPLNQRLSGDDLLDAEDLIADIEDVAEISPNGYVTVYHRTTEENAKKIMESGKMSAKEDGIFFSTQKEGAYSSDYGKGVVELKVPVEKLVLDDIFDTEAHLRIPLKNRNESLDISGYLTGHDAKYSLSDDFPNDAELVAKEYFGTTEKWSETGWLLRDGTQLDFSGRHWERDPENEIDLGESYYSGKRNMEHYEIAEAFPELREYSKMEYRGEHLDRFQNRGNIRIVGKGIVGIEKMPTEEQFEKLRSYFGENIDRVITVGIGKRGLTYPEGTKPSVIIEGIRDYFSRNRRNQSDLMQFHTKYSLSDSDGKQLSKEQQEFFKDSKVRDENGNLKVMYHGTKTSGFTVFDHGHQKFGLFGNGFYFTDDPNVAEGYTKDAYGKAQDGSGIYEVYLNIKNPIDMDAYADKEKWVSTIAEVFDESTDVVNAHLEELIANMSERMNGARESVKNSDMFYIMRNVMNDLQLEKYEAAEMAEDVIRSMGYDGLTHIGGGLFNRADSNRHRVYIALNQEQIKNTDNLKPTDHHDIRYSLTDSEGTKLTKEQSEFFKDSKAVDRNGNLLKVYHTTSNDFTVFDKARKGEATQDSNTYLGFFFADDAEYMQNFPEFQNGKTEAYYLNMKNPIDMTDISKEAFLDIVEVMGGDVQEASDVFDEELAAEQQRARNRGDNNHSLLLGNLLDTLTGEFYYNDFIEELKPHYDELMSKGYDGVVNYLDEMWGAKEYIVLDSNQAKLTTNTNPTADPDIRYSLGEDFTAEQSELAKGYLDTKSIQYSLSAEPTHRKSLEKNFSVADASLELPTIMERYDKILDIWTRLGGELDSKFLNDWNKKVERPFTVFKAQAGYKYNVELSSMCKKGVPLFEAIDTIVKKEVMKELDTDVIGKEEKEILYDILKKHHFEIPCAICYVEQARQREGVIIDAFLNGKTDTNAKGEVTGLKLGWNQVLDSIQKEMRANGVDHNFAYVSRDIATDKYDPADLSMDEQTYTAFAEAVKKVANQEIIRYNQESGKKRKLLKDVTPAAVKECFKGTLPSNLKIFKVLLTEPSSRFKIQDDLLYSSMTTKNLTMAHNGLYSLFNSQGGVSGYKTKQAPTVYWGEILNKKWKPEATRKEGGVRNQSNSDFQMFTLLDQAQMYMDFSAKGYYLQAYTKVLSELKLFGLSKSKINASLIPKVTVYRNADGTVDVDRTMENAGLDENGNPAYDDIEGINHKEAFMLLEDPEYSKNIGGICIGYSDKHISKLLDDDRVQLIIGFHDKTNDPDKRYRGARYAKNYNGLNEAVNKDGKTVHIGFNPYVKKAEQKFKYNKDTESFEGTVNYNGKTYTADDIPRLAADLYLEMCAKKGYAPAYSDGNFHLHRNYYKLLADFSLYDSQGHYAPHRKVAYDMPDSVPYLDADGNKQYMETEKYIKKELQKELAVRDAIAEAMADTSEEGIIPQFKAEVNRRKQIAPVRNSLSEIGEQPVQYGSFYTPANELKYVPDDVAPAQETISKTESVPVVVAKNATTEELFPDNIAPVVTSKMETTTVAEETTEDIAPVTEAYEAIRPNPAEEAQWAENKMARADKPERTTRKDLHRGIVDSIKSMFTEKGFDFDEVLNKAKNLSTFATVDNTPQRVMEKSLGYKEGQILSDLTVNKVAQNETEGIKWLNSFTDRKNGLLAQISKQYNIKPGSKESAAAQMYAEGFYVDENNNIIQYGDAELEADFKNAKVRENIKGLANDSRIRQIYDDTLAAINESRTRNAYPEIPRLDNYFLHFRAMEDTFSRLGLPFNPNDIRAKDLPTDLNGVTADLKPGQPYFASAMHRTGKRTSFDLLGGLEKYLTSAKNQIYHIDDIQTLRALRNYVADTYGQANGLEGLDVLSEEEAQDRIEKVYNSHLSTFAKFLNEEANILAGKTALIDRGLEGIIGRRGITFLDTVNKQVGSNMVGFNLSSSLTNFLPVAQTFAKTNKRDFVKAFGQTVANKVGSVFGRNDSFTESSPVVIRRKGADRFYRTPYQKVGDAGYVFMSAVDDISTELIARTKYNELTRKGMDSQQAHYETDKWVSRLMGDRSLGQMPQIYNSKMLGLITKFQLEVRNQLDSQFYDTIQEAKVSNEDIQNGLARNAKTAAKVASTFVQLAVVQHLFGKAFESVAGYNPAFDIISVMIKALGWDDDEESEDTVLDNIEQGFFELLEDLPYTSTFTGGRIPIESALPIKEFLMGEDQYGNEKSRWETLGEVAPYYLLPGGYGQVKKTTQGLNMFSEDHPIAGSYTDSGSLRFPVDDTLANRVQAGIFGQWANENAQDYIDNGRSPLDEKRIQEFLDVGMTIQDYWNYREGLSGLNTLAEKADYIDSLDLTDEQKNVLINNIADRKEDIDMSDYGKYDGFEEFDFATKNPEKYAFLKKNNVSYKEYVNFDDDAKDAYDWAFKNPEKYTLSQAIASDVVKYRRYTKALSNIKADKDANGNSISGSRKEKVIDYINDMDLDYGQKIILYRSMYDSQADKDAYNYDIVEYLNSRNDISYEEMETILKELGFEVDANGNIFW